MVVRLFAGVAALFSGCTKPNPVVCCTSPADCNSLGIMETMRSCDSPFVCVDHKCSDAPDAQPGPQCMDDTNCAAPLPYCSSSQQCVQCVRSDQCAPDVPVCDPTNVCRGCRTDDECASGVCDATAGTCVSEGDVLYVSSSGSSGSDCTRSLQCTLTRAIALASASRFTVKMAPGSYTGSIAVIGKDLFIHATGVTFNGSAGVRTIQVSDGAHLKLFGMSVIDPSTDTNFGIALSCDTSSSTAATATVELDGVSIDSGYTTVLAQPCNVSIANSRLHCRTSSAQNMLFLPTSNVSVERSVIDGGDGVWCEGANSVARITNSVIKNQSGPDGAVVGSNVFGQGAGAMTVSFSTIVDSLVKCGSTPPRCAGGTGVGSCLESSIVANTTAGAPADSLQGAGCATTYSLVFPQTTSVGPNNVYGMSPKFQNGAGADYHLMMGSPAINTADPGATVSVDFDGIGRPQDGRSDMGAFEFKP